MPTTLSAYQDAAVVLPDEYFLGAVVTFTISEADVPLDEMRAALQARKLRATTLPRRLRPIDAFRRSTAVIATRFARHDDHQHSILVRPVGQDEHESHRHVVFERAVYPRSGGRRRVEHVTIFKIMFDRDDGYVHVEPQPAPGLILGADEQEWITRMIGPDGERLRERYHHDCTHLGDHGVRTFARNYLRLLRGINVGGSGGLYFVPQEHVEELRRLADVVKSFGSAMHLIPLLDCVDQRRMLAEAFIDDTLQELRVLGLEIDRILDDPKRSITDATFESFAKEAAGLMVKADQYQALLDDKLETADLAIQMFKLKAASLAGRVQGHKVSLASSPRRK